MQKTWFVTGASRGFGAEIAKAAVRSGDRVVATGRKRTALIDGLGPESGQLISVELQPKKNSPACAPNSKNGENCR